jgi:hypothetical protein
MDLGSLAHTVSGAGLPLVILAGTYYGARTLTLLTALYGSEKLSKRAFEVLRILRSDRDSK